jgi:translation initiation factor 2 subunit 3
MYIVRSFDVNKPGSSLNKLRGGVIGGTLLQGKFEVGEEIELRPGLHVEEHRKAVYKPLFTEITSLHAGGRAVKEARSGGLVGIGTSLDPSLTKADGLIGNLAGKQNVLPPTLSELTLDIHLFERAVGTKEMVKVDMVQMGESVLLHVGTIITMGTVISVVGKDTVTLRLGRPVCAETGSRAAISRKMAARWRLIGYGVIKN